MRPIPRTLLLAIALASTLAAPEPAVAEPSNPARLEPHQPTADHGKFEILKQDFRSGPEVTAACLTCHTEAAKQIMKTSHWTWICPDTRTKLAQEDHIALGKAEQVVNNFCIAIPSNEPRCTSCHAGYGWKDQSFDFTDETLVDCLVCHDTTGSYRKFPSAAGHPVYESTPWSEREWPKGSGKHWEPVRLDYVARNVGPTNRDNCGQCHFFGSSGEGVKHGDMDEHLSHPPTSLDVHMSDEGAGFQCGECHTTRNHKVAGRCFELPTVDDREFVIRGKETNLLACESCHSTEPHRAVNSKLDDHTDKVSCQACHIPTLARAKATKMWWDWSRAGRMDEQGKPFDERNDPTGETSYDSSKGEFIWAENIVPDYIWYDGSMKHTFMGDLIDDSTTAAEKCVGHEHGRYDRIDENAPLLQLNQVATSYDDPRARIWPAKIHKGRQPYDPVNKTLVVPKLYPSGPDSAEAYWSSFDWDRAITAGMAYADLPYSGEYDFIQTEMIWPLKHTVAPAKHALQCVDCHHPEGRLKNLTGFYLPGRDRNPALDTFGIVLILLGMTLALGHGLVRIIIHAKG
jgi:octaheme c-type cytochrome (tetrathionate reductase family)